MSLGIGHGLNDGPLDRSALDRVKQEAARKGRALTAPDKRNAYVIDTDSSHVAVEQLVTAFKAQNPSIHKIQFDCRDGSTVTISVKSAKKGSKK